jgi:biopolymer transport protein ExbD
MYKISLAILLFLLLSCRNGIKKEHAHPNNTVLIELTADQKVIVNNKEIALIDLEEHLTLILQEFQNKKDIEIQIKANPNSSLGLVNDVKECVSNSRAKLKSN